MDRATPPPFLVPPHVQPVIAAAVLAGLVGIAGWLAWTAAGSGGLADHDRPPERPARFSVNINAAGAAELAALPGVGPTTAARILEHRLQRGPFRAVDDLGDVPGIGPATLEQLRPHLRPLPGDAEPTTP